MQEQQKHGHDIEAGDEWIAEAEDDHSKDVMPPLGVIQRGEIPAGEVDRLDVGGEMEQMEDDEGRDDEAAHEHGAGGITGGNHFVAGVGLRPGGAVFRRQFDRRPDMQEDRRQQTDAHQPEQVAQPLQECSVTIQRFRPEKHLQVAGHVPEDEEKKRQAGGGHDELLAHRGGE